MHDSAMTHPPVRLAAIVVTLLVCVDGPRTAAHAQGGAVGYWSASPTGPASGEPTVTRVERDPPAGGQAATGRRFEFVIAPLPIVNPTLENGGMLILGMLYPVGDRASPPSASFVFGMATSNGSQGAGFAQTLHLDGDRYRVLVAAGRFDVNFQYFGIGSDAGDQGQSVRVSQEGDAGLAELLVGIGGKWYAGARYRLMQASVSADLDIPSTPIPPADLELTTALLGPRLELDTRDSQFYPTTGTRFEAMALFAGEAVGGRRRYENYQLALSRYVSVKPRHVIAGKINSCLSGGDAPFYDLCLIGQFQDLRGYPTGQYRDRAMLTAQAEYRYQFWWRFGLTAFGGVGQVAPAFTDFNSENLLPTGGAGIRFRLTPKTPLNLRVDYAWGRRSSALYISVGEAF